jgi:hypothetical protein
MPPGWNDQTPRDQVHRNDPRRPAVQPRLPAALEGVVENDEAPRRAINVENYLGIRWIGDGR